MKYLSIAIVGFLFLGGCSKDEDTPWYEEDGVYECPSGGSRIGAKCNDGTYSTATGSGACSHHNGVEVWLCQ